MPNKVYIKNIGLDLPPPKEVCEDKYCVWHGELRVRGKIFRGIVVSDKMDKTVTVVIPMLIKVPKYERYIRKRIKIKAHNPPCINARVGDIVVIGETRKISKTKAFVVLAKVGKAPISEIIKLAKKVPEHILKERENESNKSESS